MDRLAIYFAANDGPPTTLDGTERFPLASSARTKYSDCRVQGKLPLVGPHVEVGALSEYTGLVTRVNNVGGPAKPKQIV